MLSFNTSRINVHIVSETVRALAGIKGGWPGKQFNMAPKFKKPKKTRGVSGPLHGRFSARKHVYRQLRDAVRHSHHEELENSVWGVKVWSWYLNGSVR